MFRDLAIYNFGCTPVQTQACQSTVSSLAVVAAKPNRYSHSGAYTSCNSVSRRPQWGQSLWIQLGPPLTWSSLLRIPLP